MPAEVVSVSDMLTNGMIRPPNSVGSAIKYCICLILPMSFRITTDISLSGIYLQRDEVVPELRVKNTA